MSRLYDPEPPITVVVDDQGRPATVTRQRHESVREGVNRWRVDDDWWRVQISRTYYGVVTPAMLLEVRRNDRAEWLI